MPSMSGEGPPARALVLDAPRSLREVTLDVPEIGEDDGVLRVEACGLCGTDHELYTGTLPSPGPFVPGHEAVGVVERAGASALRRWGVELGQRVAVEVFQSCGTCAACAEGTYRRCERHGLRDMYGWVPVANPPGLWGGYATHQYLAPDSLLLPVPDGLDPVLATAFNPLGAGIRWGVTVPGTRAGDVVAILGPGIRGLAAVAAVKEAGARFVLVTGRGAGDRPRLEAARAFGADAAVDVEEQDPVDVLRSTARSLADVVVDVTAKAPGAFAQALALARPGGTVVVAGTRGTREAPGFTPDAIVYKELRVQGALGVDAPAYRAALELLASRRYPFEDLPRRVEGLAGATDLISTMAGESDDVPPVHAVLDPWR